MKSANKLVVLALLGHTEAIETLSKMEDGKYPTFHRSKNYEFNQINSFDDEEDLNLSKNAEVNDIKAKVSEREAKAQIQEVSDEKDRVLSGVMNKEDWFHTPYHE